jgi:hypothetical protein
MLKTRITEQYGLKVPFINAGMAFIATKVARLAATTAPPQRHSRCSRQSSMQSLPCLSSLPVASPMAGPLLLRWRSAPCFPKAPPAS